MAALTECPGIRYIMKVLIINLVGCLAWLSGIAFAQLEFSEAVTGSVSFPDGAIACLGNLAVFFTSLLRGRLDMENAARDVLATNRGPKLKKIKESGLTTCIGQNYENAKVVMLSPNTSNPNSIRHFMRYVHHCHNVESILLKSLFLEYARKSKVVTAEPCSSLHRCSCIVLWTEEEEIRMMIARRMPGTLMSLSDSLCLLPCWSCLTNGCHGCNQGLLHVSQTKRDSTAESPEIHPEPEPERTSNAESRGEIHVAVEETRRQRLTVEGSPAPVCQTLDFLWWRPDFLGDRRCCICIPLREAGDDEWTKLMIRFLRSKDQVTREVRVGVSDAMEKYIDRTAEFREGVCEQFEGYSTWSLIVLRLIEVFVNIVLTGWLRVDGFSSSLIARRVVRDYLVDGKGTGFCANAFLTSAFIRCNESSVCQGLWFRENIAGVRTFSYVVGSVNLICSISWGVLIACEGRFAIHSMPPSKHTLLVMLAFIAIALLMDFPLLMTFVRSIIVDGFPQMREEILQIIMHLGGVLFEIVYIVLGTVMVVKGIGIGKWVYGAFQGLIWIKWGIGSYLLGDCNDRMIWSFSNFVIVVYSSAFMLNAVLAGVRGKWEY